MSKHAVNRVKEAVGRVTEKIERASDEVVTELDATADDTINKFGKVKTALINPLKEAGDMLDELLLGDNYPPEEESKPSPFPSSKKPKGFGIFKPTAGM